MECVKFLIDSYIIACRCEAFSTYPRTYDLIHANGVFSMYQDRYADRKVKSMSYHCSVVVQPWLSSLTYVVTHLVLVFQDSRLHLRQFGCCIDSYCRLLDWLHWAVVG